MPTPIADQLNIPYKFYSSRILGSVEQSLSRANIDPDLARALRDTFDALLDAQNEYERNNNLAIERWASRNINEPTASAQPFIVVAADGTGQYTSIKAAIDAVPTGAIPAGNLPTTIIVKATGTTNTYNDAGAGSVNVDDKKFQLIGLAPSSGAFPAYLPGLQWTFDGFTNSTNGTYCYIQDLRLDTGITATPVFGGTGAWKIGALRCGFNTHAFTGGSSLFSIVRDAEFIDCDLSSTALFASGGGVNVYGDITIIGGTVSLCQTGTVNIGNSINKIFNLRIRDAELKIPGSSTVTVYQSLSGSDPGTGSWIIDGCRITNATNSAGNTTISFSYIGEVQWTNNILGHQTAAGVNEPALTLSLYVDTSGSFASTVSIAGNSWYGSTVQLNNAGEFAYLSGAYQLIILSGSNIRADVTLWGVGASGIDFINVSGSYCSVSAAIKEGGGGGNTGIRVSGNNNILTAAGASTCATPTANTGAGNVVTTT